MSIALSIDGRHAPRTVAPLAMWCNTDEFPEAEGYDPRAAEAYYELVPAEFRGLASPLGTMGPGAPRKVESSGSCMVTIAGGRAVCMFLPADVLEPALWFSLPRAPEHVSVISGEVRIAHCDWEVRATSAVQHFRASGRYSTGEESSFVKQLSKAVPDKAVDVEVDVDVDSPAGVEVTWTAQPGEHPLLFVESKHGRLTGRTSVTDPSAARTDRLSQLRAADWLPDSVLEMEFGRVVRGAVARDGESQTGYLMSPVPATQLAIRVGPDEPPRGNLSGYLWPILSTDGVPELEHGEREVMSWTADAPSGGWVKDCLQRAGMSQIFEGARGKTQWMLTDRRIIAVCKDVAAADDTGFVLTRQDLSTIGYVVPGVDAVLGPLKAERRRRVNAAQAADSGPERGPWWAMHLRLDWVIDVYCEDWEYPSKKPLFRAATPARTSYHTEVRVGDGTSSRAISLTRGASDSDAAAVRQAVLAAVEAVPALHLSSPETRTSDNGREGRLTANCRKVEGGPGFSVPAALLDL